MALQQHLHQHGSPAPPPWQRQRRDRRGRQRRRRRGRSHRRRRQPAKISRWRGGREWLGRRGGRRGGRPGRPEVCDHDLWKVLLVHLKMPNMSNTMQQCNICNAEVSTEQLSSRRVLLVSWMSVEPLGEEISVTSKGRRLHHDDMRSNWRSWRKKSNEIETPPLGAMRDWVAGKSVEKLGYKQRAACAGPPQAPRWLEPAGRLVKKVSYLTKQVNSCSCSKFSFCFKDTRPYPGQISDARVIWGSHLCEWGICSEAERVEWKSEDLKVQPGVIFLWHSEKNPVARSSEVSKTLNMVQKRIFGITRLWRIATAKNLLFK